MQGRSPERRGSVGAVFVSGLIFSQILSCELLAQVQDPVYFEYQLRHGKEQPLRWEDLPRAIRLSGEIRGRTEGQTSYDLEPNNDRTYELTRFRAGLEADLASVLKATLVVQDTHALGLPNPSIGATMRDQFDLFTGDLDLHFQDKIHLIAGRQPLSFGSEHLVGISDWANNSRSWDGFTARFGSQTNLELFSTSVVEQHPTSLDKHGAGLTFHGAVMTISVAPPQLKIQPFVFILALPHVEDPFPLPGAELETTFGTEVSGTEKTGLEYDFLGALQRGSRSTYAVSSGAAVARVGWLFRNVRAKPRLVGEFDYASGDDRARSTQTHTFDQLYASNHGKFGLVDQFGFQNLVQGQGNLDLSPFRNTTIRLEGEVLKLASGQDNIYKSDGTLLAEAPQGGFRSNDLGRGIDISSTYMYRDYLLFEAGAGHLFPGEALAQSGQRPPETLGYFQIDYKFNVTK